jgi:hypothetical protein
MNWWRGYQRDEMVLTYGQPKTVSPGPILIVDVAAPGMLNRGLDFKRIKRVAAYEKDGVEGNCGALRYSLYFSPPSAR